MTETKKRQHEGGPRAPADHGKAQRKLSIVIVGDKQRPRIPLAASVEDFRAVAAAGRALLEMHVHYEAAGSSTATR